MEYVPVCKNTPSKNLNCLPPESLKAFTRDTWNRLINYDKQCDDSAWTCHAISESCIHTSSQVGICSSISSCACCTTLKASYNFKLCSCLAFSGSDMLLTVPNRQTGGESNVNVLQEQASPAPFYTSIQRPKFSHPTAVSHKSLKPWLNHIFQRAAHKARRLPEDSYNFGLVTRVVWPLAKGTLCSRIQDHMAIPKTYGPLLRPEQAATCEAKVQFNFTV